MTGKGEKKREGGRQEKESELEPGTNAVLALGDGEGFLYFVL